MCLCILPFSFSDYNSVTQSKNTRQNKYDQEHGRSTSNRQSANDLLNGCTEDKRFLEFWDRTSEFLHDYNEHVTCVKLPNGRIVEENSRPLWGKFIVKDGFVYQKEWGPLHHPKRSKRAKKMKALPDYPRRKIYKSFEDYLDQECYAVLNEETGKYGEWFNPDGVFRCDVQSR